MFRLNLSQNICSEGHGASVYIQKLVSAETVDGLFDNLCGIVSESQDKSTFRGFFNRDALLVKFARGEERTSYTYRRMSDGGEPHWVTTFINMLQNPDTNDVEAIAYSVDVDRAKREEEILAAVTDREFDFIALIDVKTRRISFQNITAEARAAMPFISSDYEESARAACRCNLDGSEDEDAFLSSVLLDTVTAELGKAGEYNVAAAYRGTTGPRRKKLSYRWLNDSKREILLTRADITDAFRQEQKQADKIRKALLTAERANNLKSEFLSNVSHDLRTPMNAVLGYADLAMKTDSAKDKDEYLGKILRAGKIMASLINDTLDLSRIETGVVILKPEPVRGADVIQKIMTTVTPWLKAIKTSPLRPAATLTPTWLSSQIQCVCTKYL
jgi:signal transduction histidine kinase